MISLRVLTKMPQELRNQVKEITLDMAGEHAKDCENMLSTCHAGD